MPQYPSNIDLSTLDGVTGFKLSGESLSDISGVSVNAAGDVNGDGFADVIIGAQRADAGGGNSGASYVVFGAASGFAANLDLSALNGSNGFRLAGAATGDYNGSRVAGGDVNGDGFADLIVSSPNADANGFDSGASYVVFGKASGFAASLGLSTLDGGNGFKLTGAAAGDRLFDVASGDVNGDGFADVILGAEQADPHGASSGAGYVVFGKAAGFGANIDLSTLNGTNGFKLSGVAGNDFTGIAGLAGDVNGDGFDDVIISAAFADPHGGNSGATYVVFGKASGFATNTDLSALDGTNGFKLSGEAANDYSGQSVSSAGDINGDGFADLIIGAPFADANGADSGAGYVVFGKASGFTANLDLSTFNGTTGFKLIGAAAGDSAGQSVAAAGDVNGDGFDDVIIGGHKADPHGADSGAAYIVFGKASGFASSIDLSALTGTDGFKLSGVAAGDYAGFAVSSAGDVNGDGLADLMVGAFKADPHGNDSGASYVVFGRLPDAAVNRTGTAIAQTLVGGNFNDTLSGLGGDDRLFGHGGNDNINGGTGNDIMVGGLGNDTYTVDSLADVVTENANEGTDTVVTALASYTLPTNVENLTGTSASGQTLTGNGSNNVINGGTGADTMTGGAGNDTYVVNNIGDAVIENANEGTDTVNASINYTLAATLENLTLLGSADLQGFGNSGANTLTGNSGNNLLDGGAGADSMFGNGGNDVYFVDNAGDAVFENTNGGNDSVFASVSFTLAANVENLILQGSADLQGYGNGLANVLNGNTGSNLLNGNGGVDLMAGGAGDDVYFADDPSDACFEVANQGNDSVFATCSYGLAADVEGLILQGSGDFQAYGNNQANTIYGNTGNNLINAGGGIDLMAGGAGNDVYYVDDPSDACFEVANEGSDAVFATCSYGLAADVETLILQGSADLQGYGNNTANTLNGNTGNNLLNGGGGADLMVGGAGNDVYFVDNIGDGILENAAQGNDSVFAGVSYALSANVEGLVLQGAGNIDGIGNAIGNSIVGNAGNNTLDGGAAADQLTGNAGNDIFLFRPGQAIGDAVVDFAGNGAAAGDSLSFIGYGVGATFTNINATHWQVNYNGGVSHDIITFMNGAPIDPTDFTFA